MSISRTVYFAPLTLPAGRLTAAIEAALLSTGLAEQEKLRPVTLVRRLADGSTQELDDVPFADVDVICDLSEDDLSIRATTGAGPTWHYLAVYGGKPGRIHIQTPTAGVGEQMVQALMTTAGLSRYVEPEPEPEPEPPTPSTDNVPASSVGSMAPAEPVSRRPDRRLRAFLSYRFGTPENEAAAAAVQRFLELENVEVLTGRSYEPRPLREKVADRLAGLDFLVLVVGADGESSWGRDEISTARAQGALVIPIVTDGAKFDPGLFGDLEYITVVDAHVGDAFIPLLEALAYIRRRLT